MSTLIYRNKYRNYLIVFTRAKKQQHTTKFVIYKVFKSSFKNKMKIVDTHYVVLCSVYRTYCAICLNS